MIASLFSHKKPKRKRPRIELESTPAVIYAVGDVHGSVTALKRIEELLQTDAVPIQGSRLIVMLGDYVDRGPDSAKVLDHLLAPPPAGFDRICLAGNHDDTMLSYLQSPHPKHPWLSIGGLETLSSYGLSSEALSQFDQRQLKIAVEYCVPTEHADFLASLPAMIITPDYLFTHAALRAGVPLAEQSDADLLWYDDRLSASFAEFGRQVVHGHIGVEQPFLSEYRIGLDTLAFATGRLSAVRLVVNKAPIFLSTSPDLGDNA